MTPPICIRDRCANEPCFFGGELAYMATVVFVRLICVLSSISC